jgi:hypothetical protein
MASSSTPERAEELLWSLGVGENLPKWLKESRKRATMPTLNEKKDQIAGRIGWQESSFNLGNMSVSPDGPQHFRKAHTRGWSVSFAEQVDCRHRPGDFPALFSYLKLFQAKVITSR